jgi:hypothetical protein
VSPEDMLVKKEIFQFSKFTNAISKDIANLLDHVDEKFGVLRGRDGEGEKDEKDEKYEKDEKEENEEKNADAEREVIRGAIKGIRERYSYLENHENMQGEFASFVSLNSAQIDKEFDELNEFRTSVRGFKVRGVYDSLDEAKARAKKIESFDNKFNVFVCQVGCWCPWSPNPEEIQDSEYAETQLNTLVKSYKENEEKKNKFFEERKEELIVHGREFTERLKKDQIKQNSSKITVIKEEDLPTNALLSPDPWMASKGILEVKE